jgi:hypothetical protein
VEALMGRGRILVGLLVTLSLSAAVARAAWTASAANTVSISAAVDFKPTATGVPSVSGTIGVGGSLTGSVSGVSWRSAISVTTAYQWQLCTTTSTATCVDIAGATALTYNLGATPVASLFRLGYSATNAYGTNTVYSVVFP